MGVGPPILPARHYRSVLPRVLCLVDGHYIFAGECYTDGIMYGKLAREFMRAVIEGYRVRRHSVAGFR